MFTVSQSSCTLYAFPYQNPGSDSEVGSDEELDADVGGNDSEDDSFPFYDHDVSLGLNGEDDVHHD